MPTSRPKHDPWADLLADPAARQAAVEAAHAKQERERQQPRPKGPDLGSRFD